VASDGIIRLLIYAPKHLWRLWAEGARKVQAIRARWKAAEETRNERGMTLLREWLSLEQKAQLDTFGHFDVIGCDTGTRYRIRRGMATNVYELDAAGQPIMGWCFVPSGPLVAGDVMLAQKIALETNERNALAIANRFSVGPWTNVDIHSRA
jgi:hypothetical protein